MQAVSRKNKKAFTLLELILVIVILGVLVTLALPKMFEVIDASKRVEAFANFATIRRAFEVYKMEKDSYVWDVCTLNLDWLPGEWKSGLRMDDPGEAPGAHFDYVGFCSDDFFVISAHLKKGKGAYPYNIQDYIVMYSLLGEIYYQGYGVFDSIGQYWPAPIQAAIDAYNASL